MKRLADWFAKFKLNANVEAQGCHFFIAYSVVHTLRNEWAAIAMLALAAFLEFYFDPRFERHETTVRDEDFTDFLFYQLGVIAACIAIGLHL